MTLKKIPSVKLLLVAFVFLASCGSSKKLISVVLEDSNGDTELVYARSESPENLVKEVRFFPNGDTLTVTPMLKGKVHRVVARYVEGNTLVEEVTFKEGMQDGVFRRYDKNGVLVFEGELTNGQKTGTWTTWYDDVQMEEQRSYTNDEADGKWTYWYIDGSLKREEVYENGKLIDSTDY